MSWDTWVIQSHKLISSNYNVHLSGAFNPARDLGPRIFASMIYGSEAFSDYSNSLVANFCFWYIPILGPLIGGVVGAVVYTLCISAHWKIEKSTIQQESPCPSQSNL